MDEKELLLFKRFSYKMKGKRNYLYMLNEFKAFVGKDLINVSSDDVSSYLDNLENSKNTKRRKYHELLSFYNYLLDEGVIGFNPVKSVSAPSGNKQVKLDRTLTFDNVKLFLDTLHDHFLLRDYIITFIIATTGLKVSEVLNIKWKDFILDSKGHIGVSIGNKENQRYVRIFDFIWDLINDYRVSLGIPEYYLKEDYIVFFSERNIDLYKTTPHLVKPITTDWLLKVYSKACVIADIPLITSKDIRHNYTMLCMKLGTSDEEIKEQLGWSSKDFIYRYHGVVELLDSPINKKVEEFYTDLLGEK